MARYEMRRTTSFIGVLLAYDHRRRGAELIMSSVIFCRLCACLAPTLK